ncbi:hypothetical protein FM114_10005 [Luteococcus japonicus LSP_Lj1]|uniref:Uncharacterized protein n=1 Tax=Luteococcus japonicus LSP_Lj1 TaxID=1255658 RepID=A0A1R4JWY1_9ACTN|nr:hypothetical protein FM114_10005 [Luteococcus japonicus LSP_Lj1]
MAATRATGVHKEAWVVPVARLTTSGWEPSAAQAAPMAA